MTAGILASLSLRRPLVAVALAALSTSVSGQPLPQESPFAAAPATPAKSADEAGYELLGMSVVGKTTLLSLSRLSDHRSYWIPLGGIAGDITAVSYNAKTDEAVVRVDGKLRTLAMRRATVTPAPPAAAVGPSTPNPAAAAATTAIPGPSLPPLTAREEKEMEARMLVSDLLDIGQQQRKAYEAARKAVTDRPAADSAAPPKK